MVVCKLIVISRSFSHLLIRTIELAISKKCMGDEEEFIRKRKVIVKGSIVIQIFTKRLYF